MENHMLNLQLLDLQNTLASSNENLLCDELERMAHQCGSNCHKKVKMLLQNSFKDKKDIKELELKLAKLEVNVATYADKIKDKDDVIAALKMSIDLCKMNKNNVSSSSAASSSALQAQGNQLAQLQRQIQADAISLKEKDDLLKESEGKIECLTNQVKHLETRIQSDANHLLKEGKAHIEARERHIGHLITELKKKDAQLAQMQTEINQKDVQITFLELDSLNIKDKDTGDYAVQLQEKNKRLATLEETIVKHTSHIAELQTIIKTQESQLKETENLLISTKNQLKEKDKPDKNIKEFKAKILSLSNTIKQLKQNITDLQTEATANKLQIVTQEDTIKELKAKLKEKENLIKSREEKIKAEPKLDSDWMTIQQRHIQHKCPGYMLEFYCQLAGYNYEDKLIWAGVETLHMITAHKRTELYIHLVSFDDTITYARYDNFVIGDASEKFQLKSLGKYTGNAGDGMRANEKKEFSHAQRGRSRSSCLISFWWSIQDDSNQEGCDFNMTNVPGCRPFIWWMGDIYKSVKMLVKPYKK